MDESDGILLPIRGILLFCTQNEHPRVDFGSQNTATAKGSSTAPLYFQCKTKVSWVLATHWQSTLGYSKLTIILIELTKYTKFKLIGRGDRRLRLPRMRSHTFVHTYSHPPPITCYGISPGPANNRSRASHDNGYEGSEHPMVDFGPPETRC